MKYMEGPWIVLFGGAGREGVIARMVEQGVEIRGIIVPSRQSARLRMSMARLAELGVPVKEVERDGLADALAGYQDCLLLSVGFPYIIPMSLYSRHKAAINMHPTLLPKYRGPTTGAYILMNGEKESGSTVHVIEEEADKGDILAQSRVPLSPFDTLRSLQRKVYESEPALIISALRDLDSGKPPLPQDESAATSYPRKRRPEDSEIDPTKPLLGLIDEIRACDSEEFPAFFFYQGQRVCVKLWRQEKPPGEGDLL